MSKIYPFSNERNLADVIIVTNRRFVVSGWNGAAEELFGFVSADVLNNPLGYYFQIASGFNGFAGLEEYFQINEVWRGQVLLTRGEKAGLPVGVRVMKMAYAGGEMGYVWGIEKREGPFWLAQESYLDSLFEGVVTFGKGGEVLVCNKAAQEILGIGVDDLEGLLVVDPRWDCIREDGSSFPIDEYPVMITLRTGMPCKDVIMGIPRVDGGHTWVTVNSQPVVSSGALSPHFVTCTFVDITEQRYMLEELRKAERIQRLVLSSTTSGLYILDEGLRISAINKAGKALTKALVGKEIKVGDYLPDFIHESRKKLILGYMESALDGIESMGEISNGDGFFFSVNVRPLFDEAQKIVGIYIVVRDITKDREAARIEQELRESHQKLEKRLLTGEINNKKAIIKAMIGAQEKEKKEISDELHDNVSQLLATCNLYIDALLKRQPDCDLLKECKTLVKTSVQELRNISHSLTPAAFSEKGLFPVVEEMIGKINRLGKVAVVLSVDEPALMEAGLLPEMKTALYRIVQEQVKNILKHSGASEVSIRFQCPGDTLVLEMADNGRGVEMGQLKKGLGLNNIQSRVSLFNGELFIRSAPGKGCVIKAVFPFTKEGS